MYNGSEITPEFEATLKKVISDTGRNFSIITGLIFSGIISLFVFITGKTIEIISMKSKKKHDDLHKT
jgi:hypothetical protein